MGLEIHKTLTSASTSTSLSSIDDLIKQGDPSEKGGGMGFDFGFAPSVEREPFPVFLG